MMLDYQYSEQPDGNQFFKTSRRISTHDRQNSKWKERNTRPVEICLVISR